MHVWVAKATSGVARGHWRAIADLVCAHFQVVTNAVSAAGALPPSS
jgi:hypothetical protein